MRITTMRINQKLCGIVLGLVITMAVTQEANAQQRRDAFTAGIAFSVPTPQTGEQPVGGLPYEGGFRKYEIYGAYEKFILGSFFVMPEVSLWYSDNYDDIVYKRGLMPMDDPYPDPYPDLKRGKEDYWQIGGTISILAAWRQPIGNKFSVDLLTGPRVPVNIKGHIEGYNHVFSDFYRPVRFEWRFGIGANLWSHWRVGVSFDLRPGRHKKVDTGVDGLKWNPSDEKYRNEWSFSLGYRF